MTTEHKVLRYFGKLDWRIWFGVVISGIWLASGLSYVLHVSESTPTALFSLDAVGSFLEGVFAPLAFLWLVIGMFIQQRELANNTEALRKTSEQSEKQTQAIAATEMNARQETFFKIAENVKQQLGGISGMLLASSMGPAGSGGFGREQLDDYFARAAQGDSAIFARMIITKDALEEEGIEELLLATKIRRKHTRNYVRTFERLCRLAKNCDVDGIILASLMESAFGLLYTRMIGYRSKFQQEDKPI